jgi:hypothetical protein
LPPHTAIFALPSDCYTQGHTRRNQYNLSDPDPHPMLILMIING